MSRALKEITQDVIQLSREERLALARILLDLEKPAAESDALWDEEIKERVKAYDEGKVQAVSYEETRNRLNARFA